MEFMNYIGPGLAVGLAGLGVAIGQGILAKKAMQVMGKRPEMSSFFLTVTILGIALVESAVIYGFIIAFQILGNDSISLLGSIGAGLAIGLAGLGAGIGEGKLVAGAIGAIDKNPEAKAKIVTFMVLFIALVESAAIYGLVVAFKILGADDPSMAGFAGMGMAVGLAGLGVAIGEGIIADKAMGLLGKKSSLTSFFLTVTILGIALVESAAIYGLVVSFDIFNKGLGMYASIGAGLAIGLAGLGAGIGEGMLIKGTLGAIDKNPEIKGKLITFMVLFVALIEVTAIYGLIIAFKILGDGGPDTMAFIGAGLSVGLAGLGVAIGRGYLSEDSLLVMGKNPKMINFLLTVSILGVALVESAAIYALIVSFQILTTESIGAFAAIGAGLAIGLTGLGAGVGEGKLVAGALKAIVKTPELKGKLITFMVLFVALIEVTAIYGLIIAFKILGDGGPDTMAFIGAGLSIGLAGLGVAIGRGYLSEDSLDVMGKNPKMISYLLTVSVLGVALVESAAIYALIVSFQILGTENIGAFAAIGAGLAIGLAGLGAGIGEGKLVAGALQSISNNPKIKGKIMTLMVLFVALVESAAIYGLVVAFKILGTDDILLVSFIGMGMAVGFAGLGVAIGEGLLAKKAMESIGNRPEMLSFFLTVTILGIALVESAAIYGLVVAFDLLNNEIALYASAGAGLAIGLAGLGAGIGEGMLVSGAISAIERNPKIKGKIMTFMVLFIALVEVTAIYGFIVAFKIIGTTGSDSMMYLGAGLSIGLAGLGVAIGRGYLSEESIKLMGKNPKVISFLLTVSILGVALVESAAIYALIVSFQILAVENIFAAIGAGVAIGFAGLGVGIGEGMLIKGAMKGINVSPESKGKTLAFMVLFVALVEVVAIYGLIIAFKVLG